MDLKMYELSLFHGTAVCHKICYELADDFNVINNYVLNVVLDIFCQIYGARTVNVPKGSAEEQQYLLNLFHNDSSITITRPSFYIPDSQSKYFIPVDSYEFSTPFLDSISFEVVHPIGKGIYGSHIAELSPEQIAKYNEIYNGFRGNVKVRFSAIQSFLRLLLQEFSMVENLHYVLKILNTFSQTKYNSYDFTIFNNAVKEFVIDNTDYAKVIQYNYTGWKELVNKMIKEGIIKGEIIKDESVIFMSFTMYNTFSSIYNKLDKKTKPIIYNLIRNTSNHSNSNKNIELLNNLN